MLSRYGTETVLNSFRVQFFCFWAISYNLPGASQIGCKPSYVRKLEYAPFCSIISLRALFGASLLTCLTILELLLISVTHQNLCTELPVHSDVSATWVVFLELQFYYVPINNIHQKRIYERSSANV